MSRHSAYYPPLSNTSSLQSSTQSTVLQTRINAKKAELENLKQLRDLSATLAAQMGALEQKLATLRDGTEAVAHVLANWDNVLNVIGMAGAKAVSLIPNEQQQEIGRAGEAGKLPETLVRIPVQDGSEKDTATTGE